MIELFGAVDSAAAMVTWQAAHRARVNAMLDRTLTRSDTAANDTANDAVSPRSDDDRLWSAMRYAVLPGGKRLRALLVYAAAELGGAEKRIADAPAAAVELLHAYSLVHDDLPCMDDDALRRGQPACHIAFGEAMALLAGDALQAQAFLMLAQSRVPDPGAACAQLAKAVGAHGMAGGQACDLQGAVRTVEALETMHQMKTGALIEAAVMLGAACSAPLAHAARMALARYAACVGLAFQVADDVLDVEGSTPGLGKTAGKDAAQNKVTYVTLLGLDNAKQKMQTLCEEAQQALEMFGTAAWPLKALAVQAVTRSN